VNPDTRHLEQDAAEPEPAEDAADPAEPVTD
jgi:hypothetical protein